jgi:phosphatidylglycerol---prolipoprotein diacylglyceryl transferase
MPPPYSPFVIQLGPLAVRWYSLLIILGIMLAVWLTRVEFRRRGYDPALVDTFALVCVPLGIIGGRLYHVLTTLDLYRDDWLGIFQIWRGGLGIYGAVIAGALGMALVARWQRVPIGVALDAAAPGLVLAQAIGRWGNYFNQEIFGPPTSLPWGLYVEEAYRPAAYAAIERFHPTFLYESLWNLAVGVALLWLSRRFWRAWRPGTLALLYVAAYSLGRFALEGLKVDDVLLLGPVRFNQIVSLAATLVFAGWFLLWLRQARRHPFPVGPLGAPSGPAENQPAPAAPRRG